jgi:hypothetical protein
MKWIVVEEVPGTGKTKRFIVATADTHADLGWIRFYPRWRKYAFYPNSGTLYESDCLHDIANFCADETRTWRTTKKRVNL